MGRQKGDEVEVAPGGDSLSCRVNSAVTGELAGSFSTEMDRLGREHGIKKFLIDGRGSRNTLSNSANLFSANADMLDMELQQDAQCANVADAKDRSHDSSRRSR